MTCFEFKRLNRTMMIYRTSRTVLLGLLIFIGLQFQQQFALLGKPQQFTASIIAAIVIQLVLVYPIFRTARRDAELGVAGSVVGLSEEKLIAIRKKRLSGDLWKCCVVVFYITIVVLAPDYKKAEGVPPVLSTTIFSFLLTCLTYFNCFNFSAKKRMKQAS